jgi:hypothetical protein
VANSEQVLPDIHFKYASSVLGDRGIRAKPARVAKPPDPEAGQGTRSLNARRLTARAVPGGKPVRKPRERNP